jgi:transposase-like protein
VRTRTSCGHCAVVLRELLEAENGRGAGRREGASGRQRGSGCRSGYNGRTLIARIGKLELQGPQDRHGRSSTELFERYQRSEKALVAALAEARCDLAEARRDLAAWLAKWQATDPRFP